MNVEEIYNELLDNLLVFTLNYREIEIMTKLDKWGHILTKSSNNNTMY